MPILLAIFPSKSETLHLDEYDSYGFGAAADVHRESQAAECAPLIRAEIGFL